VWRLYSGSGEYPGTRYCTNASCASAKVTNRSMNTVPVRPIAATNPVPAANTASPVLAFCQMATVQHSAAFAWWVGGTIVRMDFLPVSTPPRGRTTEAKSGLFSFVFGGPRVRCIRQAVSAASHQPPCRHGRVGHLSKSALMPIKRAFLPGRLRGSYFRLGTSRQPAAHPSRQPRGVPIAPG
jgi:hypothetical protein